MNMHIAARSSNLSLPVIAGAITASYFQTIAPESPAPISPNEPVQPQTSLRNQTSLFTLKPDYKTNRACQAQTAKQNQSRLFENHFSGATRNLASKSAIRSEKSHPLHKTNRLENPTALPVALKMPDLAGIGFRHPTASISNLFMLQFLCMEQFQVAADKLWFKHWPAGVPRTLDYPDISLFGLLTRAAEKWPESAAFSFGKEKLTYKNLDDSSSRLAAGLHRLGVKPRDKVLLFLSNSLEFPISYYGILKAGATVVTVNPLSKQAELKHQLGDTQATALITNSEFYPIVKDTQPGTSLKTVILTDAVGDKSAVSLKEILEKNPPTPSRLTIKPSEDVAAIVYTGGTTGLSKGVLLTHRNLVANAMQNAAWFGWSHQDIVIGLLPFYHSWGGCACMNSPIYSGARVIITPRFDAEELLSTIESEKATVMYGAASMFTSLVNDPAIRKHNLSSLRYVKSGAMPIPPEIRDKWEKLTGVRMVLGYGLSEASPETHNSPLNRIKAGTIGIPGIDTEARIVDEQTGETELPPGQTGELIIRGPQVMKGYLNRPDDTREALRNGWLYTGDLAQMDEDGYFRVLDRKKETIKYKGYTIAPAEVEATLYEHPAVRECAVIGKLDTLAGELPKAFVVLKAGQTATAEELIDFCAARIAPYKRIREVEFISEIPKTPVGKLLRRILRDKERAKQA